MSDSIDATYDGRVFHPLQPVALVPNTRVRLTIRPLQREPGKTQSFLDVARSLELQGPPDWSTRARCGTAWLMVAFLTTCIAAVQVRGQERKKETPPESLEDLGRQVVAALRDEDYEWLQSLAISPAKFAKLPRTTEKAVAGYKTYHEELPKLAKRYRKHLESNGFFNQTAEIKLTSRPGEEKTDRSTGLLAEAGAFKIELIDQAVRLDKTWYILRLVTGRDEKKLPD